MIGQRLGSFLIDAELGAGAMGVVYRGTRETGKTRVAAVKVIAVDQMAKGRAFDRFLREAEILEQFRHPNIVKYLARGKTGKTYYYAMEYVAGQTLDKIMEDRGPLPWIEVVAFAVQICDALHYAHEHSVIHRDLKPSNLMVTEAGVIKLTDFGIAKDLDATALTATGRTLGTAAYMAPEQIRGTPEISHKTDLYALGILLYQMLTGELPFQGGSAVVLMHLHMTATPPRPSDKTAVIPVELDDLVVKLMGKAPNDRPWDAQAVAELLRSLLDRYDTKQPIPMVWPEEGASSTNPTRAFDAFDTFDTPRKKSKKKKKVTTAGRLRAALPTLGLLAGLVVVALAIGYVVWPPSARYLHAKAAPLMASDQRTDWLIAESMYLDELDRRFPDHPYKAETEGWRDRIALTSAERRSEVLEKSGVPGFKKADGQGEQLFSAVFPEADAAIKRNDDLDAARRWREMATSLEKDRSKSERGWLLLARKRAEAIDDAIKARAKTVNELIGQADASEKLGFADRAVQIRRDILHRFGKYTDLAETIEALRAQVPADEKPKPAEAP